MWGVEDALREVAAATALTWRRIHEVLTRAEAEPWEWVPAAFGATSPRLRELAVRSATADLAMRLRLSDATVRTYGSLAERLQRRLPTIWAMFAQGSLTAQHARIALEASDPLGTDAAGRFDAEAAALAESLPPGRFRTRAVALAERIQSTPLQERHDAATQRRGVWLEDAADGMAWLHALLPAAAAHRAMARLDAQSAALAADDGETRGRDQLRADVASDLLTGDGTPHAVRAEVIVTVPVLSLLGIEDRPATLDGVVPIDPATARELTAMAPSLRRLLTDPVSSAALDLDRNRYRPSADLQRWVRLRDGGCCRPGCRRRAAHADLDHVTPWRDGGNQGPTSASNLAVLCRADHTLKHQTGWRVEGERGRLTWTSPTGAIHTTDPPPF